jgi:AAA family ATP:ADP antiporter
MRPITFPKRVVIETIIRTQAHELVQAALLGTYLFLIVTSTVIGKAVRDALFLSHFTALQMTYADLQTIIAVGIAIGAYFRLQRSLIFRRLLISSSVFFAIGDTACWWAATFHQRWLTRAIYYWVGTQAAVTLPQVSMLARQVLTTRQAKRHFGLIGTGAIFGWILGGLVTRAAAERSGTEALLLVMAALTATGPIFILAIWRTSEAGDTGIQHAEQSLPLIPGLFRGTTLVWISPHLRTVAFLVFVSSVVTTIAGLQFRAIASQSIGATDRLAAFFGSFSFQAGLLSLVIQILWTSRILRYFGVGASLIVAPVALATGSVGVLLWGTLPTAVFLKGSDHVLRHSIDRAALELLYAPLAPNEALQTKMFIEAVVYRIGDGVGTLAVVFGATVLHLSFPALSFISLGFLAAWIGVAMQARHGYVEGLLATLRRRSDVVAGQAPADDTTARTLNPVQTCQPHEPADAQPPLGTTLAAEIVGLYRLVETSDPGRSDVSTKREYQESVERICRLLKLIAPEHDPLSALAALQSGDARLKANGLEYLENILEPQYRRMLIPLLEARDLSAPVVGSHPTGSQPASFN